MGKIGKKIHFLCNILLSSGARFTLVTSTLEEVLAYWYSLAWISKCALEKIRNLCFRFLWGGKKDNDGAPIVKWKTIAQPKEKGGWGLSHLMLYGCRCVGIGIFNHLMTSLEIRFWILLSTMKCGREPFTHIYEWKRLSPSSVSFGSAS